MPQVLALVGRVDRHRNGAGQQRAPPAEQRLRRVLHERRHAVARLHPELDQRPGDTTPGVHDVAGRQLRADDVEVLTLGVRLESPQQQVDDRALVAIDDPRSVAHQTTKARSTMSWSSVSGSRSLGMCSSDTTAGSSAWYAEINPLNSRASTSASPLRKVPARCPRRNIPACSPIASSYRSSTTMSSSRSGDKVIALE